MIRLAHAHQEWALGFLDEVWWSRFAQPKMHSWAPDGRPLRLEEQSQDSDDDEPKALSCYGVLLEEDNVLLEEDNKQEMLLRFVEERPVSSVTTRFLEWVCQRLSERGKRVWALVWDRASWHTSHEVRDWIRAHNAEVKCTGEGVRIIACLLPSKSPWLNPIEPKWLHGKRAIVEPNGTLSIDQVMDRVCAHYDCDRLDPIAKKTT